MDSLVTTCYVITSSILCFQFGLRFSKGRRENEEIDVYHFPVDLRINNEFSFHKFLIFLHNRLAEHQIIIMCLQISNNVHRFLIPSQFCNDMNACVFIFVFGCMDRKISFNCHSIYLPHSNNMMKFFSYIFSLCKHCSVYNVHAYSVLLNHHPPSTIHHGLCRNCVKCSRFC